MGLLEKAKNQTAYLKIGFLGFQGSGKTYTASRLMGGILQYQKIKSPKVAMFDTEKSSDFLIDYFKKEVGADLFVVKSRSFKQLIEAIKEAEKEGIHAFMVDSVTHVWRELMQAYQKKLGRRNGLYMQDWAPIKEEWYQFTDLFINSRMHFASLGRAGWDWDQQEDETGKKQLVKLGTKMKAEGEFGYESDILIEMERIRDQKANKDLHRAWVLKDRWALLDGKHFDDPKAKDFLPIIERLSPGGNHFGVDTEADSQDIFGDPDYSIHERKKQAAIAIENLQGTLVKLDMDGTSAKAKKSRQEALENIFGTGSKTAIEDMAFRDVENFKAKVKMLSEKHGVKPTKESVDW